jgi:hypothetical protein
VATTVRSLEGGGTVGGPGRRWRRLGFLGGGDRTAGQRVVQESLAVTRVGQEAETLVGLRNESGNRIKEGKIRKKKSGGF